MSWKTHKLGDILNRKRLKVNLQFDVEYKLVTIKLWHKGVVLREFKLGREIKSKMFQINEGDFILSGIDARNGAFGIVPNELNGAIVTNDFWCLEPKKEILRKDFFLFLTSTKFFDYICNQCSDGTTQRIRLQKEKFFNFEIALPSVDEQESVVNLLKDNNIKSEILSNEFAYQLDIIKQLRQAFLREAMQGWLNTNDNLGITNGETGHDLLAKIKAEKVQLIAEKKLKKEKELPLITEEEIPFEIPEHWAWCRLGEIANTFTGNSINEREKSMIYSKFNEGFHYIGTKDVMFDGKGINYNTGVKIPFNDKKFKTTKENSILMCIEGGSSGKKYAMTNKEICFGNKLLASEINSKLSPYFFYQYYQSQLFSNEYIDKSKGLRGGVSINQFREIIAPLPPLQEQEHIVAKLKELMAYCDGLEQSIKESQGYNEKLLQEVLREALKGEKSNIDF